MAPKEALSFPILFPAEDAGARTVVKSLKTNICFLFFPSFYIVTIDGVLLSLNTCSPASDPHLGPNGLKRRFRNKHCIYKFTWLDKHKCTSRKSTPRLSFSLQRSSPKPFGILPLPLGMPCKSHHLSSAASFGKRE